MKLPAVITRGEDGYFVAEVPVLLTTSGASALSGEMAMLIQWR